MAVPLRNPSGAKRRAEILACARRNGNVALTCRRYGISRTIFYRWRRRFESRGREALRDASRRPLRVRRRTPTRDVAKILFLRLALAWSPSRIQAGLALVHGIRISAAGIWKILDGLGFGRRPRPLRPKTLADGRTLLVSAAPSGLRPGKRSRAVLFTAIDDEAGLGVVRLAPAHDARGAASFIDAVVSLCPLRIETVVTPSRAEFTGFFHWHVLGLGIEHRYGDGPPGRPADPVWDDDALAGIPLSLLAEGTLVCRDRRINRAIAAWDGRNRSSHRMGR